MKVAIHLYFIILIILFVSHRRCFLINGHISGDMKRWNLNLSDVIPGSIDFDHALLNPYWYQYNLPHICHSQLFGWTPEGYTDSYLISRFRLFNRIIPVLRHEGLMTLLPFNQEPSTEYRVQNLTHRKHMYQYIRKHYKSSVEWKV